MSATNNAASKRSLRFFVFLGLGLTLAGCGAPTANLTTAPENSNLTAQAVPACSAVTGYSTYITYSTTYLRVCRIATPGPYDTNPSQTGNQAPSVNPDYAYIVFAQLGSGGAGVGHVWSLNQTTGTNPLLNENAVRDWFDLAPASTQVMLNGAFFDCTEACANNTSHASFPIYFANSYITLGNNGTIDDNNAKRALCFDSAGGSVNSKNWTLNSTNSSLTNVNSAQSGCPNMIVGFAPSVGAQNTPTPLTYVGTRSFNTLCFYVGGYQTRAKAQQDLTNFGCTPAVQMDGGNSSQLSLRVNGSRMDVVRSWEQPQTFYGNRLVPHAFRISF